jgi:hypothetical protein
VLGLGRRARDVPEPLEEGPPWTAASSAGIANPRAAANTASRPGTNQKPVLTASQVIVIVARRREPETLANGLRVARVRLRPPLRSVGPEWL